MSLDRKDDLDDQADEDSNQDTYSYSNDQTAIADDNNSYDCASSVSSASTYRQKFKNSFWSNHNKIMRHILIALIIYIWIKLYHLVYLVIATIILTKAA